MTLNELIKLLDRTFPDACWGTDNYGQLIIYTGKMLDVDGMTVIPFEEPEDTVCENETE